eukprot:CAMPEP_0181130008 /NCGR_PEP_ID=MMETSP1071-20121207/29628_1 /TAXON_ID=35127 /ORGANISM="Thalassiosira sp., Strain NH16" /LENGTH=361 /DNA_ID=CAMNT_0023216037 /DNA_START=311 /DNA_END=1393 /DNA_ORIENTATION=-
MTHEHATCSRCSVQHPKVNFSKRQWKVIQSNLRRREGLATGEGGRYCIACVKYAAIASAKSKSPPEERNPHIDSIITPRKRAADTGNVTKQHRRSGKRQKSGSNNKEKSDGGRNKFTFDWEHVPISTADERKLYSVLVKDGEYGRLSKTRRKQVMAAVAHSNISMNFDQAMSYRACLLQQKTMQNHHRLGRMGGSMVRLYHDQQLSVVEISRRFDLPPMNVFRTILKGMNMSKMQMKTCLRDPKKIPRERERTQLRGAERAYIVSNLDQSKSLKASQTFEDSLARWFENKGVRLRRQEELVEEQKTTHGRAIRSPDIIFLDDVAINGTHVAWIDAKNFYGANIDMQRKGTENQVRKYLEEW